MLGWGSVDGAGNYTALPVWSMLTMVYASWVSEKSVRIAMPYCSNVRTGGCASVNGHTVATRMLLTQISITHIFECTHRIRQWPLLFIYAGFAVPVAILPSCFLFLVLVHVLVVLVEVLTVVNQVVWSGLPSGSLVRLRREILSYSFL